MPKLCCCFCTNPLPFNNSQYHMGVPGPTIKVWRCRIVYYCTIQKRGTRVVESGVWGWNGIMTSRKSGQTPSLGVFVHSGPRVSLMIWLPDLYDLEEAPGWSQQLTEPVLTLPIRLFQWISSYERCHLIVQIPKVLGIILPRLSVNFLGSTIWQNLKSL